MKTILMVTANPKGTTMLRLDEEVRDIQEALKLARDRGDFKLEHLPAARWEDVRRVIEECQPEIVHFSGHGVGEEGLAFEESDGSMHLVSADAMARMFALFPRVDCVVLNACYAEVQAIAIHEFVPCVLSMNRAIGDRAAREFAVTFYDGLGAGRGYQEAFNLGLSGMANDGEVKTPVLLLRERGTDVRSIELEPPGNRMPIESKFYVMRSPAEEDALREIMRPGALIRIKAPYEYGKSSLMGRVVAHAEGLGARIVSINFREVDSNFLESLPDFLRWFCNTLTEDLDFEGELDDRKGKASGYKKACGDYFEKYLLPQIPQSLVLELDEVDRLLEHHPEQTWVVDFFSMLRAWYDSKMKAHPEWKKLRLVLVHSKEIDRATLQQKQSPFNVGTEIELHEFTTQQGLELATHHGVGQNQTQQLMKVVGGHPQLLRMGLYSIARGQITIGQIQQDGATEASVLYGRHLMQMRSRIERDQVLRVILRRVLAHPEGIALELDEKATLRSFGVIVCQDNDVRIACELYYRYFSELKL